MVTSEGSFSVIANCSDETTAKAVIYQRSLGRENARKVISHLQVIRSGQAVVGRISLLPLSPSFPWPVSDAPVECDGNQSIWLRKLALHDRFIA